MNILLYTVAAVLTLVLPLRAWLEERRDPLRTAFLALGLNLSLAYLAFAVHLVTALPTLREASTVATAFIPLTLYRFISRFFRGPRENDRRVLTVLQVATPLLVLLFLVGEATVFANARRASLGAVTLFLWVAIGVSLSVVRIGRAHRSTRDAVERIRLRYLLVLMGGALFFSALEAYARAWVAFPLAGFSGPMTHADVLQGAVPPVGVLFTAVLFYVLHQILVLSRLLDLHEIFARVFTIAICGLPLVFFEGFTIWARGAPSLNPLHGTFVIFVSTTFFLVLYDPLRRRVERETSERFNRRGHILELTLQEMERGISKAIHFEGLCNAVLHPLQSSGRISYAAIYAWDDKKRHFQRVSWRGTPSVAPLDPVAMDPVLEDTGLHTWVRAELDRPRTRRATSPESTLHRRSLMEALGADALFLLQSGRITTGWLVLSDEPGSDGFSKEEMVRLRRTADRMAVVIENIQGFERMKEHHRLAALGTMSAGLAHEIRNPLAGIRGATQVLQTCEDPAEAREFTRIIVSEVDRLNTVVSQFLDYARPYEIPAEPVDVNRVIRQVLDLVRRQDLPDALVLETALAPDLPPLPGDAARLGQVVMNLVQNAVQAVAGIGHVKVHSRRHHLSSGGGTRGEGLGFDGDIDIVEIVVEDDGPGISHEDRDKLFVPFFTTRPGGTGLGLCISRRIARAHGGDIEVWSQPGRGSRFSIQLPLGTFKLPPTKTAG